MKKIILIIFISTISAQVKYPADSLLKSDNISYMKKIFIYPITRWQRISYNSNIFNCQFYPSCSNFCAISLKDNGLIMGAIIGADRIIRCNPSALYYHQKLNGVYNDTDGRLIDFVEPKLNQKGVKSPALAAILSIVPGLGRLYTGRFYDCFYSVINLAITWKGSSISLKTNQKILAPIFTTAFATLYMAEIYGSWRAAKYYQPLQKNKSNN